MCFLPHSLTAKLARRKDIYKSLHPETAVGVAQGEGKRRSVSHRQIGDEMPVRFTLDSARITGRPERSIQRDVQRGEKLGAALNDIKGTSLDKGVEIFMALQLSLE